MKRPFLVVCLAIISSMVFADRLSGYIVTKDGQSIIAHEFPVRSEGSNDIQIYNQANSM